MCGRANVRSRGGQPAGAAQLAARAHPPWASRAPLSPLAPAAPASACLPARTRARAAPAAVYVQHKPSPLDGTSRSRGGAGPRPLPERRAGGGHRRGGHNRRGTDVACRVGGRPALLCAVASGGRGRGVGLGFRAACLRRAARPLVGVFGSARAALWLASSAGRDGGGRVPRRPLAALVRRAGAFLVPAARRGVLCMCCAHAVALPVEQDGENPTPTPPPQGSAFGCAWSISCVCHFLLFSFEADACVVGVVRVAVGDGGRAQGHSRPCD